MSVELLLVRPKFAHNVGAAIRAASCFGANGVTFTEDRFGLDSLKRLPREERMKGYTDVRWTQLVGESRPIDRINDGTYTPVAIELVPGSQSLPYFEHPENALYVFGPEDGSLPDGIRRNCHAFVTIPTFHCTNLSAAIYMVLYDRIAKRGLAGLEDLPTVDGENRGWWHSPSMEAQR